MRTWLFIKINYSHTDDREDRAHILHTEKLYFEQQISNKMSIKTKTNKQ